METIGSIFSELWNVWKAMFSAVWSVLPKAVSFLLWLLSGIVILPCIYISGTLYPEWEKWGESF
ncbi:MAG: hypothetical protein NTZ38_00895 [Candidatus Taylorbacteria bacterium]|nr:hypothetical protein [Candidatus Taylorbacteria bacterium]